MYPRPRSRNKAIEWVPTDELLAEIAEVRAELGGRQPAAIVVGLREWNLIRVQPDAFPHVSGLFAEEVCFDGVPVIIAPRKARPQVMATPEDIAETLAPTPAAD